MGGATETENTKKSQKKYIVLFIAFILISAILGSYFLVANYYKSHFFPGTSIDTLNCTNLTANETNLILQENLLRQNITIWGRATSGERREIGLVNLSEIDCAYTNEIDSLQLILDAQQSLFWPLYLVKNIDTSYVLSDLQLDIFYSKEKLYEKISSLDMLQSDSMSKPEDAYIGGYNEQQNCIDIIPEKLGNQIIIDRLKDVILNENVLVGNSEEIDLTLMDCYENPSIYAENSIMEKRVQVANRWLASGITCQWGEQEVFLDGKTISDWIVFRDDYMPTLNKDAISEFVSEMASQTDTYGKNREFVTTLGVTVQLRNGGYGWKTNKPETTDLIAKAITEGTTNVIEPVYLESAYAKGKSDIGDSFVEIDLSNQHLYLYSKGELVLESDFVSGNVSANNTTPGGLFGLTYKTKNAVLRGPGYATPVSYWMPFNGNIGMHDATWRRSFGGNIFLTGGSHGCVNLPKSNAATIYEYVEKNFPVICYYYPDGQNPIEGGITEGQLASYVAPPEEAPVIDETTPEEALAVE